ncbi:ribosome maturation factor RimP [Mariprofundus micogutta]|uniref:Ribosome maturation factor RimP n=1 Tax=Mariprofundus micogutta TaxID=1921010 RepID=A0A1L8CPT1_9PROT|nr:ribosome assembly cofactor RimP [Mariprofundus micogutta]GAV20907.1 ribosome maturation factor RimP [Mariprofundus micogutta]
MEDQIQSLLQPIADELGVEILKISLGSGGHSQLLKVIVDRAGGVSSDELVRISRGLALQLDAEDLIANAYMLEVTSPGLNWPLETVADFKRYEGEWIKVSFLEGTSQEGRNLGPVEAEGDVQFTLLIEAKKAKDNRQQVVSMSEVSKVVRAINWKDVSRKNRDSEENL